MSGDVPKKPGLRYSDSPHAPDWARDPSLRGGNQITSFGQPIPQAEEESLAKPQELHYSDSPHAPDWARYPSERKPKLPPEPDEPFRPSVEWFEELLWKEASDDVRVYCIMDGYWAKGLYGRLLASPDISWAHMFQGDVALNNIQDAPFIIALKRGHKLLRWLIEEGWGDGWGIYFTASTQNALDRYGKTTRLPPDMAPSNEERVRLCNLTDGMEDPLWLMRRHFRQFSDVELEDDARVVDFRYYDPAILRTYLPSCNRKEIQTFFGPVMGVFAAGFCDVDSLNRPQDLYYFTVATAEDSLLAYKGIFIDLKFGNKRLIPVLEASKYNSDRVGGLYKMIRTSQIREFSKSSIDNFYREVAHVVLKNDKNLNMSSASAFTEKHINRGVALGLYMRQDLINFVLCNLFYGEDFPDNINVCKKAILQMQKENNQNGFFAYQLTQILESTANYKY